MKIENIYYSSHFAKAFKKLPTTIKAKAIEQEKVFKEDCFAPKLKTHKLKGQLESYFAFSIDYSHRILFEFIDNESVGFMDVGTHSIYG